ncbi:MAG: MgtC/SapB family protein [Lawsonibacter sp.]|jgi:putative Mg2+ transporter-C (MgtC) family protein|uniref:MgtC/SapB family protein n=1 Tax=Lawsonibacter sp. JLR.KK007 TaxID=3114293 RepID=UPI002173BA99|nr:MgtC/SapB family protein [Lawsonibacter sp.]MCI8989500.1 MgtC/SapB family protein [Lawsonibacter sp.]MCI9267738.1 MgtC/SapB family protein [Lawsonibacter sp.]
MLHELDFLRGMGLSGVVFRVALALLCGGVIGIERAEKRRPAGFRTHILICLGAAIAAMTSVHLFVTMHYYLDVARMGAGVVSGIGFIGAGTIMVTRRRRVKGLTTAAGLWVVAIVGLCCGFGFYEGAVYTTILVLVAEVFFSKLEYRLLRSNREIGVYVEYTKPSCLEEVVDRCHMLGVKIVDLEINRKNDETGASCAVLALSSRQGAGREEIFQALTSVDDVLAVVET